jgi:divalent metal cation (Fe/Co/Zn/Cd) transporter
MVRKGVTIEIMSVIWTVIEAAAGISSGIAAGSLALTAFGIDSVIELIAGTVLLWRLLTELHGRSRNSRKVERAEKAASIIVGVALLLLAVYIAFSAATNLYSKSSSEVSIPGLVLAFASGILMPVLAVMKKRIGEAIGSGALKADAACSMVCAYMSWVLIIGVVLTSLFRLWWADSVISLLFVYFIIREGLEAIHEAHGEEEA